MDDEELAGLLDRLQYSFPVQRLEGPQVYHLHLDTFLGQDTRRLQAVVEHQAVGDDGDVAPGAFYVRLADGDGVFPIGDLPPDEAVGLLMLQEHHRVVVPDGGLQQPFGVVGSGRGDHLEAGGVAEVGLHILRVVQAAADTAAIRDADHHRHLKDTMGAIGHPRRLAD